MQPQTRKAFKRAGTAVLWIAALAGFVVLLAAAVQDKEAATCKGIVVKFSGNDDNFFIEEKDIKALITKEKTSNPVGKTVGSINIAQLESIVSKDPWVKEAEIFLDNHHYLNIKVTQREPVARIFTFSGNSFYLDTQGERIPVSSRYAARVPVFTGFPVDASRLQKADSLLSTEIVGMGHFLIEDPFWMAQIEQVVITGDRKFELVPKLGDHIIEFGEGENIEKKFGKLMAFYKEGLSKVGWNNYTRINIAYENEVVCTRKDSYTTPTPQRPPADTSRFEPDQTMEPENTTDEETTVTPAPLAATPPPKPAGKPAEKPIAHAVKKETTAPAKKVTPPKKTTTVKKIEKPAATAAKNKGKDLTGTPQQQPKAIYKPVKKSVNTTKNNKTP